MKHFCFSIILVFLSIFFTVNFSYAAKIEFTEEALKNAPEKKGINLKAVPSYEIISYKFDRKLVNKRAKKIFSQNPVTKSIWNKKFTRKETDEEIIFSSNNIEFRVAKATGAEALIDLNRYTISEKQQKILKDEEIKEIASKYLKDQFPDINLKEVKFMKIKKIINAIGRFDLKSKKSLEISSQIANYIVIYQRIINGIPVIGSGGKIRIYLSSNGEPIGHSKIWRPLGKPILVKPVLPTNKILRIFIKRHSKDRIESIKVVRLYFGYFAKGRYTKQKNLRPFYIIGYVYGPNSKLVLERYDAYTGKFIELPKEKKGTLKIYKMKYTLPQILSR